MMVMAPCTFVVACLVISVNFVSMSHAITIHPAVFKNFVGPHRVSHQTPILRSTTPFDEDPYLDLASEDNQFEEDDLPAYMEQPRQAALRSKSANFDKARAQRGCRGNGPCRRNLDSTLNLLMRMMETGRRR